MFKKYLIYVVLVAGLIMAGCGGGGGGSSSNPPENTTSFRVNPGETVTKAVDDTTTIVVPSSAFPQGADVVITTSQVAPPNKSVRMVVPPFKISTSVAPQADLTVRVKVTRSRGVGKVVTILAWEAAKIGWQCVEMKATSTIDELEGLIDKGLLGTANAYNYVVAELTIVDLVETQGIVLLAGTGQLGTGSLIVVHGFNDTAESMRLLAQKLVAAGKYKNVYGITYDWRVNAQPVAEYLGTILDGISQEKSVDILAHSRGALIARYTLEKLGKTKPVKNFISVCGANQGSFLAKTEDLLRVLWSDYLNRPESGTNSPFGVAAFDTPALAELNPNNTFLSQLNQTPSRAGNVNYFFIGGDHDTVVGTNSAVCPNLPIESFTLGVVERSIVSSGHSDLVKTEAGINTLIGLLRNAASGNVIIELDGYVTQDYTGWVYTLTIHNYSTQAIVCRDLSFEEYARFGDWNGTQWYSDSINSDDFFPIGYSYWGKVISLGSSTTLYLHNCYDRERNSIDATNSYNLAKTVVHNLRFQDGAGKNFTTSYNLSLSANGNFPEPAKTRAARTSTPTNGTMSRTK